MATDNKKKALAGFNGEASARSDNSLSGKAKRFSEQLKTGRDFLGEELSDSQKAYRSGYLAHSRESAQAYYYNTNNYEKYSDGLKRDAEWHKKSGEYFQSVGARQKADKHFGRAASLFERAREVFRSKSTKSKTKNGQ